MTHQHNATQFGSRAGRGWMRMMFVGYNGCDTCGGRGWVAVDDGDGGTKQEQCQECKRKQVEEDL